MKSIYPPQEVAERILFLNQSDNDNYDRNRNSRKSSLTLSEGKKYVRALTRKRCKY